MSLGGGGGTLRIKILVDDGEIKRKMSDAAAALEELDASASNVKGSLDGLGDTIDDAAIAAGKLSGPLGDADSALAGLADSSKDIEGSMSGISSAFADVATGASDTIQSLDAVGSSFGEISQSALDAEANISQAAAGFEGIGTATSQVEAGLDAVTTSLESVSQSALEAEANISQAAVGIEGIGTATQEAENALSGMGSAFSGAGTSAEQFSGALSSFNQEAQGVAGGLTSANTAIGNFGQATSTAGASAKSAGSSMASMAGTLASMGAIIGLSVGVMFRLADAQFRVDRANYQLERSTNAAKNAQVAFNALLAAAPSNTAAIAQAQQSLAQAMQNLARLEKEGITSGAQHAAAQAAVATAVTNLRAAFAAGGGDVNRFDQALGKVSTTAQNVQIKTDALGKALRGLTMAKIEVPFAIAGLAGTVIQATSALKDLSPQLMKIGQALGLAGPAAGGLTNKLSALGGEALIVYDAFLAINAGVGLIKGAMAIAAGETEKATKAFQDMFAASKQAITIGPQFGDVLAVLKVFGIDSEKEIGRAVKAWQDLMGTTDKAAPKVKANVAGVTAEAGKMVDPFNRGSQAASNMNNALGQLGPGAEHAKVSMAAITPAIDATKRATTAAGVAIMNEYIPAIQNMIAGGQQASQANQALADATKMIGDSISESTKSLDQWKAVQASAALSSQAVQIELNNIAEAAIKESFAIEAAIKAAGDMAIQHQNMSNAIRGGVAEILTWAAGLDDAAAKQKSMQQTLAGFGLSFSSLPAGMEPTIENLKRMGEAAAMGGHELLRFKQDALQAFSGITAAASSEIAGLAEAMRMPPTEIEPVKIDTEQMMRDMSNAKYAAKGFVTDIGATLAQGPTTTAFDQWFSELAPAVQQSFSEADKAAAQGLATMQNTFADIEQIFAFDISFGTSFAQAGQTMAQGMAQLAQTLRTAGGDFNVGWAQVFEEAAKIAATGGANAIQQMRQAITTGLAGGAPAAQVLDTLKSIPLEAGTIGGQGGTNLISRFTGSATTGAGGINWADLLKLQSMITDTGAAAINAGTAFANGFSQGAIHIHAVIRGIQAGIDGITGKTIFLSVNNVGAVGPIDVIKTKIDQLAGKSIPLAVNIGPALIAIGQLQGTINQMGGKTVAIVVNIGPALLAMAQLQTAINQMGGKTIAIAVNIGPALIAMAQLQTAINLMGGKTIAIAVNIGPALIAMAQLQTAVNQMGGKTVAIAVNIGPALIALSQLQGAINGMTGKTIPISVNIGSAGLAIGELQKKIDGIKGKDVMVNVNNIGAIGPLDAIRTKLNQLQNKTIVVTVRQTTYARMVSTGTGGGAVGTPVPVSAYTQHQQAQIAARYAPKVRAQHGFGPEMVTKPTLMLVGEAGPELVQVVPMQHGTQGRGRMGGGGSDGLERALSRITFLLERFMMADRDIAINFNADGERLAGVAYRNMGVKGYGDRF